MSREKQCIWLIVALMLLPSVVAAQAPQHPKPPDKTLPAGNLEKDLAARDTSQNKFISNIEKTSKKSKFLNFLTAPLFSKNEDTTGVVVTTEDFSAYNGKIVRNLIVVGLDPFEDSHLDPESVHNSALERMADATHLKTKNFILRNNLMFRKGDKITNDLLLYNLAYFRNLRYIYDAHLLIDSVPQTDSVDIQFIIRDVWSIGLNVRSYTPSDVNIEAFDRNMLGFGFDFRVGGMYQRVDDKPAYGYSLSQQTDNIRGSFIASNLEWMDAPNQEIRKFAFNRAILPQISYVGGVSYNYTDQGYYFVMSDTTMNVTLENEDIWAGRIFNLSKQKGAVNNRLAILLRFGHQARLSTLPNDNNMPIYYPYEDYNLTIGSISLFRQNYYTDRLIYGFGSHENIPYGYNVTLQLGYQDHAYAKRMYSSASFSYGKQHPWGYSYVSLGASSFFNAGKPQDGMVNFDLSYFSPLYPLGRQALRHFFYASYTRGINRSVGEGSYLLYADVVQFDLSRNNAAFSGTNRLSLSGEIDLFSTVRILGFRFVFFTFFDATWLGNELSIFSNDFLPGVGGGIRIRNDKLVFQTLQIKLGWYPNFPQSGFNGYVDVSGVDRFMKTNFVPTIPGIVEFK